MLISWFQREVSIDDYMGPTGSHSLESRLVDPAAESQEQKFYRLEVAQIVRNALVSLSEREALIIRSRFGIHGTDERTLEEIADGLHLSRERVRQLEVVAKAKLRKTLSCCAPAPALAGG